MVSNNDVSPAEPTIAELEDDFLADCAELLTTHPMEDLEIRASLAGLLVELRGIPPVSVFDLESLLARAEDSPAGYFLSTALGLYGPDSAKRLAAKAAKRCRPSTDPDLAAKVDALGRVDADTAIMVIDPFGDSTAVCVEFTRLEGDDITEGASVLINNTLNGIAGNFSFGAAATQDILDAVSTDEDMVKIEISLDRARAMALPAIEARIRSVADSEEAMAIDELLGLVKHRFETLPESEDPTEHEDETDPVDPEALAAEFTGSAIGEQFGEGSPHLEAIGREICKFAESLGGDPMRWSPAVAEMFFEGWMHAREGSDPDWLGDVYLGVKAWVRWAGDYVGLGPHLIAKTIEAISELSIPESSLRLP